jgi:hypothetical protein
MSQITQKLAPVMALLGVLWAPGALPISHIGGGKLNSKISLFRSSLGVSLYRLDHQLQGALRVINPQPFFPKTLASAQEVLIAEISLHYRVLQASSRDEARKFLNDRGWTIQEFKDPCVIWGSIAGETGDTHVLTWGLERGVMVFVSRSEFSRQIFQQFVSELELLPGACAW